ncbi:galactokinase [Hyphobacterium sp. CCMP332]|uniref:galactokinase n=1 Tax=Hyphobacterium sp. CCMP332 TaxID=2749086 RepID=UPI00164F998C|nr:galactokinase family protein [Hyphobacterium sp. CCMP332]QNL19685.1 galactokinase [Hyphobacterium sp. CCMP332]
MRRQSWTPGRVNLIGEWIDFNGGLVLPAALPLGVTVTTTALPGVRDRVSSAQFDNVAEGDLDQPASGQWADYVFGALQTAREMGWVDGGIRVHLDGDIPAGAGVSSSAAVTVGVLAALKPDDAGPKEIALLARRIENEFIGVPCGIMDQMAVTHARPGELIALDTISLGVETLPIPKDWRFAVIHSGVGRQLADGQYAEKRRACLAAAEKLGVDWLCQATNIDDLDPRSQPVARHVVSEHKRSVAALEAVRQSDISTFAMTMNESHASLRDDFLVSTAGIDDLVRDATRLGARGARLTGAGFGGCIVALLGADAPEDWWGRLNAACPQARLVCWLNSENAHAGGLK